MPPVAMILFDYHPLYGMLKMRAPCTRHRSMILSIEWVLQLLYDSFVEDVYDGELSVISCRDIETRRLAGVVFWCA